MLFELRNTVPDVSAPWIAARDLFLAGKARAANELAISMRGQSKLTTGNDHVLSIEIARAMGDTQPYFALVRIARKAFPEHPFVQLYYSRMLQSRSRHIPAIRYLGGLKKTLGAAHPGLWGTQLANLYADAGFTRSSRKWMDKVANHPEFELPLALYARACAADGMRAWETAIELARQCVESAPRWSRARLHLVNCLLARGKVTEAQQHIQTVRDMGHEESYIDFISAMLYCALGEFETSARELQQCLDHWPNAQFVRWAKHMLYVLHIENGRYDAAAKLQNHKPNAKPQDDMEFFGLPKVEEIDKDRPHNFIPIPLVTQNKSQCVPTTVAMASYPQGHRFDPDRLYREMDGRDGTPLWQMRNWVNENGMRMIPVQLEIQAITGLLDRGIPLIGTLEGIFNSHVDVVCGYHAGLQVFYVRDPSHWGPLILPYALCLKRYELHDGVMAVITETDTTSLEFANRWRSSKLDALLDLQQAAARGERQAAELAAAKIDDDSKLAYQRDEWGMNVVISQQEYSRRMEKLARDPEANQTARWRALLGLDGDLADSIFSQFFETEDTAGIGSFGRLYVSMLQEYRQGNWKTAHQQMERLLLKGGGISSFWSLKSDLLSEIGEHKKSQQALNLALELSPENLFLRQKALGQQLNHLTYHQYASEIESIIAEFPNEPRLLWGRVDLLADGPDGLAYESAIRDHLHWFPRDLRGYSRLSYWFAVQGRSDLADSVMDEARALMPDDFDETATHEDAPSTDESPELAASDNLSKTPSPDSPPPAADKHENNKTEKAIPDPPLPETTSGLLDILWASQDPRRNRAIQRLVKRMASGKLKWVEHAQIVAHQIANGSDHQPAQPLQAQRLLPNPTPGPAYWYVGSLLEAISNFELSSDLAKVLIKWQQKVAPDYRKHVSLWFQRILLIEQAGLMERALSELAALLKAYPAYSSALYRMGVVKHQQGDLSGAINCFERALEVNPGLYGAMDGLRLMYESLEDHQQVAGCVARIRKKMPYHYGSIRHEVLAVAQSEGHEAARQQLKVIGARCSPVQRGTLQARLAVLEEDHTRADKIVNKLLNTEEYKQQAETDEDMFEDLLQARLSIALHQNDNQAVDALCGEGLERWPDSTRLKLLRAEAKPANAGHLLRDVIVSGAADPETAYRYLMDSPRDPVEVIVNLINETAEEKRQSVAELFCQVTRESELLHCNQKYLEWANHQFPKSRLLKNRLAEHYSLAGQADLAAKIGREVYEENPDDTEATWFYGRMLIDKDTTKALPLLEKACATNRSVQYLFDLARGYHVAGKTEEARSTHREILKQNPYMGASVSSLHFLGEPANALWPFAKEIVRRGGDVESEYFLIAAVDLAMAAEDQVPEEWGSAARVRMQILQTRPGFLDERSRLQKALKLWERCRRKNRNAGLVTKLLSRTGIIKTGWIPRRNGG